MNLCPCVKECEEGVIAYEDCGVKLTVPYHVKDLEGGGYPLAGDKVQQGFSSETDASAAVSVRTANSSPTSGGVLHQRSEADRHAERSFHQGPQPQRLQC